MESTVRKKLYEDMLWVRMVEERIADMYAEQEMRCPVHLSIGQEGVAVGVCAALKRTDQVLSGHRSHAHYLAKGGNLDRMMAEIYGKVDGCSRGRGGSMHLTDRSVGFVGATPIVGSTIPIAVGVALSIQMRHENHVVGIFFGDGAMEAGVIHESLNFSVLKKLPILFICENNLFSVYSPMEVRQPQGRPITRIAEGHGMKTATGDGNNVEEVFSIMDESVKYARSGKGPVFLEFSTYRWREHCGPNYDNDIGYRTEDEFESWKSKDPVSTYEKQLLDSGILSPGEPATIQQQFEELIQKSFAHAKSSQFPESNTLFDEVYA